MSTPTYDEVRQWYQLSYDLQRQRGTVIPFIWPLNCLNYFVLVAYLQFSYYSTIRRLKYLAVLVIYALSCHSILYCRTLGLVYGLGVALLAVWQCCLLGL